MRDRVAVDLVVHLHRAQLSVESLRHAHRVAPERKAAVDQIERLDRMSLRDDARVACERRFAACGHPAGRQLDEQVIGAACHADRTAARVAE
jgi:hypothetical protein